MERWCNIISLNVEEGDWKFVEKKKKNRPYHRRDGFTGAVAGYLQAASLLVFVKDLMDVTFVSLNVLIDERSYVLRLLN